MHEVMIASTVKVLSSDCFTILTRGFSMSQGLNVHCSFPVSGHGLDMEGEVNYAAVGYAH